MIYFHNEIKTEAFLPMIEKLKNGGGLYVAANTTTCHCASMLPNLVEYYPQAAKKASPTYPLILELRSNLY